MKKFFFVFFLHLMTLFGHDKESMNYCSTYHVDLRFFFCSRNGKDYPNACFNLKDSFIAAIVLHIFYGKGNAIVLGKKTLSFSLNILGRENKIIFRGILEQFHGSVISERSKY